MSGIAELFDEARTLEPSDGEVAEVLRRVNRRHAWRSPRVLVPVLAAAALLAPIAREAYLPVGGAQVDARAAELLDAAAASLARQPDVGDLKPGQYLYTVGTVTNLSTYADRGMGFSLLITRRVEAWTGLRKDRVRSQTLHQVFRTPTDRQRWIAAGRPPLDEPTFDQTFRPGSHWSEYPTDPDRLYAKLQSLAEPGPDATTAPPTGAEMFVLVKDILRDPSAPAQLRAAAIRVAGRIAGARIAGTATDSLGRTGIRVVFHSSYWGTLSDEFLFDPHTHLPLAERAVRPDSPPAERTWNSYPVPTIVDGIDDRP
jgi:hypothetical protein